MKPGIWAANKKNPVVTDCFKFSMKDLCENDRVKASKVFPHSLRKLFTRTFYCLDKDIAKQADILGHSSINTTRIYFMTMGVEHRRKNRRIGS